MAETIDTRIGALSFTHDFANGYPTEETIEKLYDERDFQRACQAYLWALPIVGVAEVQHAARAVPGCRAIWTSSSVKLTPNISAFSPRTRRRPTLSAFPISPRQGR